MPHNLFPCIGAVLQSLDVIRSKLGIYVCRRSSEAWLSIRGDPDDMDGELR